MSVHPEHDGDGKDVSFPGALAALVTPQQASPDTTQDERDLVGNVIKIFPWAEWLSGSAIVAIERAARNAAKDGLTQFVDLNCGIPPDEPLEMIHRAVRMANPAAKTVYVNSSDRALNPIWAKLHDPDELSMVRRLKADITDVETVLQAPEVAGFLDLKQPTVFLLGLFIHLLEHPTEVTELITGYLERAAPGSRWVLTSPCSTAPDELWRNMAPVVEMYAEVDHRWWLRDLDEIARIVPFRDWWTDPDPQRAWEPYPELPPASGVSPEQAAELGHAMVVIEIRKPR